MSVAAASIPGTPAGGQPVGSTRVFSSNTVQVLVCSSLSFYNAVELLVLILTTFKKWNWKSLYFVSMLVASFGIIPYNIGLLLEYFRVTAFWVSMTISSIGWTMLITGQSLVLYSRLNLVFTKDQKSLWILKLVKWMIIIDALVFHISITTIQFQTKYGHHKAQFERAIFYGERIQMTGFCIQEFIISGLYVWKTMELLKVISKQETRRTILGLFMINVIIILLDVGLLVLEYRNLYVLERCWKSFVYSVKLKLEFVILGKLVDLVQTQNRNASTTLADVNSLAISENSPSRFESHKYTHGEDLDFITVHDTKSKGLVETLDHRSAHHIEDANAVR